VPTKIAELRDSAGDPFPINRGLGANGQVEFIATDGLDAIININGFDIRMIGKINLSDLDANAVISERIAIIESTALGAVGKFTIDLSALNLTTTASQVFIIFRRIVAAQNNLMGIFFANISDSSGS